MRFQTLQTNDGGTIETWHDRRHGWTTVRKDRHGNQIGDALYSGDATGATHDRAILRAESEDPNNEDQEKH